MDWELMFVLPNLVLPDPRNDDAPRHDPESMDIVERGLDLATEQLAIVAQGDARVQAICDASCATRRFLESFRDSSGHEYRPSVLIARRRAPAPAVSDTRWTIEALVAFRNAIAMSAVLHGRAALAARDSRSSPTWSDTFDFHFAQVDRLEQLRMISPALISLEGIDTYLATPAHHVDVYAERHLFDDPFLSRALGKEWRRRYGEKARNTRFGRQLFRSLEVAYLAASVPTKNHASMHEYGVQLALWVSACEIVAHPRGSKRPPVPAGTAPPPRRRRRVSERLVLDLLEQYQWGDDTVRKKRWRVRVGRKQRSVSAVGRAYHAMYRARNAFLHGNDVRPELFFPWGRQGRGRDIPLTGTAAVVYRTALASYLRRHRLRLTMNNLGVDATEMWADHEYERALTTVFHLT